MSHNQNPDSLKATRRQPQPYVGAAALLVSTWLWVMHVDCFILVFVKGFDGTPFLGGFEGKPTKESHHVGAPLKNDRSTP